MTLEQAIRYFEVEVELEQMGCRTEARQYKYDVHKTILDYLKGE